ncbi:hypothetical protein PRIPAC_95322, partial [Pristionchus pacificus]|uniref:Uncharacterized protein n=1 Tax=Pristionchus pacificus TaxID=54126 RepID=A0A2A6B309_PRIPA
MFYMLNSSAQFVVMLRTNKHFQKVMANNNEIASSTNANIFQ